MRGSLARLDLNLLVALDALLTERSVTRAAERLRLSQPALSASLARLRIHFDDEILAREGNRYHLTPLALRLVDQTAVALDASRRVFAAQSFWNPAEARREFTVYGSDYSFATVGHRVTALAAREAPHVRFRFVHHTPEIVEDAVAQLRVADGLLVPHGFITDLPYVDLFRDEWVVLASADNPEIGDELTLEKAASAPWVFTYQSRSAFTSAGRQLQQLGVEPDVDVVVEGFLAMPFFITGTRRLGLIQRHLAHHASRDPQIRVLAPPFEATPLVSALWWHPMHQRDPEHAWMRGLFGRVGLELEYVDVLANA